MLDREANKEVLGERLWNLPNQAFQMLFGIQAPFQLPRRLDRLRSKTGQASS